MQRIFRISIVVCAIVVGGMVQAQEASEDGEWGLLFNMGWVEIWYPDQAPMTGAYWLSADGDRLEPILPSEDFSSAFPDIEPQRIRILADRPDAVVTSAIELTYAEDGTLIESREPIVHIVDLETETVLRQVFVSDESEFYGDFVSPDGSMLLYMLANQDVEQPGHSQEFYQSRC